MSYARVRGRGRYAARVRKDALPYASLIFLVALAGLALWYAPNSSQPQSSLLETTVRTTAEQTILQTTVRNAEDYGTLCTSDNVFSSKFSLFFLIPGVLFFFVGLAIVTDEYFVSALERICERLNLSEDVAGATFMAAGSSTPEFFASLLAVFLTNDAVGIGTIVGSAVFNILVIIGLSAALAGAVLQLDWRPLMRDSVFYIISVVLLLIFVLPSSKGVIFWWEGLILVCTYIVYVLFMAFGNKHYMKWAGNLKIGRTQPIDIEVGVAADPEESSITIGHSTDDMSSFVIEKPDYSKLTLRNRFRAVSVAIIAANRLASSSSDRSASDETARRPAKSILGIQLPTSIFGWILFPASFIWQVLFKYTIFDCSQEKWAHLWWATFTASILWISGISYLMVEAARISGCLIGIPSAALGLTVLAAGTSVPDALASISVAKNGQGNMAVSNAIGSNVFDILLGLGIPWFLGGLIKSEDILVVTTPITRVVVPIIILFLIIISLLVILIAMKFKLRPALGGILFTLYGIFFVYSLLDVFVFNRS